VPELERRPKALYSFRDLMALRTVVKLRSSNSLQAIRRAFAQLEAMDLTEHPSHYSLVSEGRSIVLVEEERYVDLVERPGHETLATLSDVFAPFTTRQGRNVVSFTSPRSQLEVREHRLGGWPTIRGTRIPYDSIADLVADGSVDAEGVRHYFPSVAPDAVADAVSFAEEVQQAREVPA
jgi:uncharacterized protein (DUF433 family)